MKVFLPQFIYSHPTYNKTPPHKKHNPLSTLNKTQKVFKTHRLFSHANSTIKPKERPQRSKSMMKTQNEHESCILMPNNESQQTKQPPQESGKKMGKNKSQILNKLSNFYSQQEAYFMDFSELPVQIQPELQSLQKYKNREQLIHYRKNTKIKTNNLIELRKSTDSRVDKRMMTPQPQTKIGNGSFLMAKKISESPTRLRGKPSKQLYKTEAIKIEIGDNRARKNSGLRVIKQSQPVRSGHPDCSPWSPEKVDHQIDFIFSV